jgi:two-component system, NarL family, sensor histidine kinase UhpB
MKIISLITLLISSSVFIYGQDKVQLRKFHDSLMLAKDDTSRINALRKIGTSYNGVQPHTAIYFTQKALALAEKIKWTKGISQNCLNLGTYYSTISVFDSAVYFETKALQGAKIVGDKNRIALIYINRGAAYTESQQYDKAMPDLTEALRISEETNNKDRQARVCLGICELYLYQDNGNAALPWGEKALQLAKEVENNELQGTSEVSLSGIYMTRNDLKKAAQLLIDAIPKARAAHKMDVVMSAAITLGDIYNKTHQYQKALKALKNAIQEGQYTNEIDQFSELYNKIGDTYFNMSKYNEATIAYKKGYEIVKGKNEFQKRQYGNLEGLGNAYNKMGDFQNAFASEKLAGIIKDSVTQKSQNEKLITLQTQFETERKEKEITLLKKDQQLSLTSLQKQKTFQYAAFIILILLVLIGFLVINRYRTVQRSKRIIEIEQIRNNIARNLHDDIGSTLTSINILSNVALQQTATDSEAKINMQKIKDRSLAIMENMNDIVWAINPANDELDKIILRMKEFGAETCEQSAIQFSFSEQGEFNDIKLSVSQRNNLYLIFKEALTNAVKYSKANEVTIILKRESGTLIMQLADNGKGFNVEQPFSGNGLKNIQRRASDMNAKINFHSLLSNGTTVRLVIPIP